jgi:CRP/FNR family cyclic AMP-dependent transcriptional regulator
MVMIKINIDFLEKVQIFQGLNQGQLAEIAKLCQAAQFKSETKLFEQGEDAAYLWIVEAGRVDLKFDPPGGAASGPNTISSIAKAGAFGWSSFAPPNKYRLSGYCSDKRCKLIKVDREGLRQLFEKDPDIGYLVMSNVAAVVGTRFNEFQEEAARRRGQDLLGGW